MATNLQKALAGGVEGYTSTLAVNNRTISKAEPLKAQGAVVADSLAKLAGTDVIFSISSNDASATQIFDGWFEHVSFGSNAVWVECSTILPSTSRQLAERAASKDVTYVTCTVFGRPDAAAAGKLKALLSGGTAELRARLTPLAASFGGAGVLDLGNDPGTSTSLKLCGNGLIAAQIQVAAEFLTLGDKLGVPIDALLDVHKLVTTVIAPKYAERLTTSNLSSEGGFAVDLGLKDVGHVRSLSREVYCPVPTTDNAHSSLLAARAQFGPDVDWSAIVMAVRAAAGLPPTMS